jgi:hypothetical protein
LKETIADTTLMSHNYKLFLRNNIDLIIIVLLGLLPLAWFDPEKVIAFGDFRPIFNGSFAFFRRLSVWDPYENLGMNNSAQIAWLVPYLAFYYVLENLGLSVPLVEMFWVVLWFTIPGLSMCFLTKYLSLGSKAGLVSSVFYMYNPFRFYYFPQNELNYLLYAVLPLLLRVFIDALNNQSNVIRKALCFGIITTLVSTTFAHPGEIGILIVMMFFVSLYFLLTNRIQALKYIRIVALFTAVTLFLNSWWFLPYSYLIFNSSLRSDIYEALHRDVWLSTVSKYSSLSQTFRLLGEPLLYYHWYKWSHAFLDNPIVIAAGFALPLLSFGTLLKRKSLKYKLLFALLGLFGIFLATGTNEYGAGDLYRWLYANALPFRVFVHPLQAFLLWVCIAYCILIGYLIQDISVFATGDANFTGRFKGKKIVSSIFVLLVASPLLIYSYIPLTVSVFGGGLPTNVIGIPAYYQNLQSADILGNYRVALFPLPRSDHPHFNFSNGIYYGVDFTDEFLQRPLIVNSRVGYNYSLQMIKMAYGSLDDVLVRSSLIHRLPFNTFCLNNASLPQFFTITLWFKPTVYNYGSVATILRFDSPGLATLMHLYLIGENRLILEYHSENGIKGFYYPNSLLFNQWNFLAIRFDGKILSLLVNSRPSVYINDYRLQNSSYMCMGGSVSGTFIGQIRDLKIYEKPLDDETIEAIKEGKPASHSYFMNLMDLPLIKRNYLYPLKIFALISVKYILVRDDMLLHGVDVYSIPASLIKLYESEGWLIHRWASGPLHLYEITTVSFPRVYATNNVTWLEGGYEVLLNFLQNATLFDKPVIVLSEQNENLQRNLDSFTRLRSSEIVSLTTLEDLPYLLKVKVHSTGPFFLVLSESFDQGWIALLNGQIVRPHFVANGYANGWYVGKGGDVELLLFYVPQILFFLGIALSISTLIVVLGKELFRKRQLPARIFRAEVYKKY